MSDFTSANANFTPATTQDNWALDPAATTVGAKVRVIAWGGSNTATGGYRTRWYRPTTIGSGTFSAVGTPQSSDPSATPNMRFGTFATACTQPASPSALFNMAWNVLGGGGVLALPIGGEWQMISVGTASIAGQIACRNDVGIDAGLSSYNVQWSE